VFDRRVEVLVDELGGEERRVAARSARQPVLPGLEVGLREERTDALAKLGWRSTTSSKEPTAIPVRCATPRAARHRRVLSRGHGFKLYVFSLSRESTLFQ